MLSYATLEVSPTPASWDDNGIVRKKREIASFSETLTFLSEIISVVKHLSNLETQECGHSCQFHSSSPSFRAK